MGELTPVIGNADDAFTNLSVKNSEALTETPAELAELFPTLLELALPQLSGGLSAIALPAIGGLKLGSSTSRRSTTRLPRDLREPRADHDGARSAR